jgi:hypothetical protein
MFPADFREQIPARFLLLANGSGLHEDIFKVHHGRNPIVAQPLDQL